MSLEEIRSEFHSALDGLKGTHTRESLEAQKKKIDVAKEKLLAVDEEFVAMLEENKRKAKMRSKQARTEYKAKYRNKYEDLRRDLSRKIESIEGIDKFMQPKLPVITQGIDNVSFEVLREKVETILVCPICKDKDRGNTVNDKPTCFKCMHNLVPETDLKKYNRKYRRNWMRKR